MAKIKNAVMAGCLDERTSLYFILIMNFILSGFYYAFCGLEAMKYNVITGALAASVSLCGISGFAFSEAAFTASSSARNDYKTVLYVRMVSCLFNFGLCALFAVVLVAAGRPLAAFMLGEGALTEDITHVYAMMIMIAVYALISCGVFWLRGFWQGAQQSAVDTRSQLIFCGSFYILAFMITVILVYGFHINRALSAYGLCGALILARLLCLGYYVLFDRLRLKRFKAMAKAQILPAMQKKKVFADLVRFTLPSLTMAICASIYILSYAAGALPVAQMIRMKSAPMNALYAAGGWMIPMLTMIPLIFSASLFDGSVSLITSSTAAKDKKKAAAERMFVRYMALSLAFSFVLGCLAPQITRLFYGSGFSYDLVHVMRIQAAEGMLAGLCVMSARFMIVQGLGQNAMAYSMISAALRIGLMIVMPMRFGPAGILYSGVSALCVDLFLCFSKLSNREAISFVKIFIMTFRILLACLAMNGVFVIFKLLKLDALSGDRLFDGMLIMAMCAAGALVYVFILSISGIPLRTKKKRKKKKTADDQTG